MKTVLDGRVTLWGGDCLDVVRGLADNSIDSVCTDPPYALVSISKRFGASGAAPAGGEHAGGAYARASAGFMGKVWDTGETAFAVEFWAEILRVLKPGGHVAAFGGTRSYHRLACAIDVVCLAHRGDAQKTAEVTDAQHAALTLGRVKGTNNRNGRKDTPETREKRTSTLKRVHAENPSIAIERGTKTRGELNVRWKGGSSRLNTSIRQMTENRRWIDAVKERDGCCVRCGSTERLESHHKRSLAEITESLAIKSRDDARTHAAVLFDISNGETICEVCHYAEHGRKLAA